MELSIATTELSPGRFRVRVEGEVTIHTSPKLREALKPLYRPETESIEVALDGVGFMDSSGIATLVEGLQWARAGGGRFVLSGLTDPVRDAFSLAKLDTVFEIREREGTD